MKKSIAYVVVALLSIEAQAVTTAGMMAKFSSEQVAKIVSSEVKRSGRKIMATNTSHVSSIGYTTTKGRTGTVEIVTVKPGQKGSVEGLVKTTHPISEVLEAPRRTDISDNGEFLTVQRYFNRDVGPIHIKESYLDPANGYPQLDRYVLRGKNADGLSTYYHALRFNHGVTVNVEIGSRVSKGTLDLLPTDGSIIDFKMNATGNQLNIRTLQNGNVSNITYNVEIPQTYGSPITFSRVGSETLTKAAQQKLATVDVSYDLTVIASKSSTVKGMKVEGMN